MAVVAVECVDEAEAPMPCVSAYAPEKSHAIRLGKFQQSLKTLQFQRSKLKV